MEPAYHIPVLLQESVDGLAIDPSGVYVDATYGGGGHSRKILERLGSGKLMAFDQDKDVAQNVLSDERLIFVQQNFRYLRHFLDYYRLGQVDGILADLGVSSHDFDVAERGFSFRFDGKLDMRMNQSGQLNASVVVNDYPEKKLFRLFKEYGELKNASKTAEIIVTARSKRTIRTTKELCTVLEPLVPKEAASKYLAKVFQALRIEVNHELEVLKKFLTDTAEVIKPGGRLVVISYHSLEDRLIKNFIQKGVFDGSVEKDFYGNAQIKFKPVGKKMIIPGEKEIARNPRARSAKLRIAEKTK